MNFYFNLNLNTCANEYWVARWLVNNDEADSIENAIEQLHEYREVAGWFSCDVCDTIEERFYRGEFS